MVHRVDHDNGYTHIIGNYLSLPNWLGLFGLMVNVGGRAEFYIVNTQEEKNALSQASSVEVILYEQFQVN